MRIRRRNRRRQEREIAELIAEEQRAAQRVALLLGLCPECFDDLPLSGRHDCPDEEHGS